jgi:hypothetical protein
MSAPSTFPSPSPSPSSEPENGETGSSPSAAVQDETLIARLAQVAGAITVAYGLTMLVLGWLDIPWQWVRWSDHGLVWRVLINSTWVGFGVAVVFRQRFSTYLLMFVHGAAALMLTVVALLPGRWGMGMSWWGWLVYVGVPALCAILLAPDVIRRWRKPLAEDELL